MGEKMDDTEFWWGNRLENVHLQDWEGNRKITLVWMFGMYLAQDRVQWRAFVLAVLNLQTLLPQCYFGLSVI
jgi:hypothetical protein